MECAVCKAERQRRCRVRIPGGPDAACFSEPPFVDAPYVHPFRHPSFHAQQLRALDFAKAANRRLLWVAAQDKLKKTDETHRKSQEEARKQKWLQFHDRSTAGIPGLLPLVLDLPVRFTDAPSASAREQGVFKNARGKLRGWKLLPAEQERLSQVSDPEVVLRLHPAEIYVEVESATAKMLLFSWKTHLHLAPAAEAVDVG